MQLQHTQSYNAINEALKDVYLQEGIADRIRDGILSKITSFEKIKNQYSAELQALTSNPRPSVEDFIELGRKILGGSQEGSKENPDLGTGEPDAVVGEETLSERMKSPLKAPENERDVLVQFLLTLFGGFSIAAIGSQFLLPLLDSIGGDWMGFGFAVDEFLGGAISSWAEISVGIATGPFSPLVLFLFVVIIAVLFVRGRKAFNAGY